MQLRVFDSDTNTEVEMEVSELIAKIIAGNLHDDYEYEVMKILAIIARTEIARKIDIYGGCGCEKFKNCDICTIPGHCIQCISDAAEIPDKVYEAIRETNNKIITFENKPIKPYYHIRCGGATENSENVIGSRITYLRRVLCSYCKNIEDINNESYFNIKELEELLKTKMVKPDNLYNSIRGMFEDIDADDQGRIRTIKIGNRTYKGTDVMKILNLNSTRFDYTPVKFLIKTIGMGHGLGLCLYGANEMAKQGHKYDEILNYYYTCIEIAEMQMPEPGKPLKGRRFVLDAGHGGSECNDGKGPGGTREKDINLELTLYLAKLLKNDGAQICLTRDCDKYIPLVDRANISNEFKPDFFISILQNTFASPGVSGTEVYHFRGDTEGEKLSNLLINEICTNLNTKNRGVRTADFYLLREVKASSIVIQLLYITNPSDEKKLMNPEFRKNAVEAMYDAIKKYYSV